MPETCDVLIVGGGPAGLAAAETAAKLGAQTLLLERQSEIGYPVHTSGGSWISDMRALGIPEYLYHPIQKVYFVSPRREVPLYYDPPVACVIDVRGVYQHLAARAASAGASIRVRYVVEQTLVEDGDVLRVTLGCVLRWARLSAATASARNMICMLPIILRTNFTWLWAAALLRVAMPGLFRVVTGGCGLGSECCTPTVTTMPAFTWIALCMSCPSSSENSSMPARSNITPAFFPPKVL